MTSNVTSTNQDVVFYVLNSSDPKNRDKFTAKLIQKILSEQRQADVLFANQQDAQRFDLTLWGVQPHSFIAHAMANEVDTPIQLFGEQITKSCQDVLLNLHTNFQKQFLNYQRTIEILDQTEHLIQKGRERFKQYRLQGIVPVVHKIGY